MQADHSPRIMIYSDDHRVRESVRTAIGATLILDGPEIEWLEVATPAVLMDAVREKPGFDLLILDGEAPKEGGMGVARQLRDEIYRCPPVIVLIARPADAWLASWSLADGVITQPIDPIKLFDMAAKLVARGPASD